MYIVSGANGQLGSDVCNELKNRKLPLRGIDTDVLDIRDENAVKDFFENNSVSCFIHCAAYTAVDKAESEKELCFQVNYEGTKHIAKQCELYGAKMIYISTDYVFDGKGDTPFEINDKKAPLNTYGKSKLMGEQAIINNCSKYFIIRTSWVYGEKNTNFIATMLHLAKNHPEIKVVSDQIGSPTYSKHLAKLVCDVAESESYGIYHGTGDGFTSWSQFAEAAFQIKGISTRILPIPSKDYPTPAKRPLNSRLSKKSLSDKGFSPLPHWKDGLAEYLQNI